MDILDACNIKLEVPGAFASGQHTSNYKNINNENKENYST